MNMLNKKDFKNLIILFIAATFMIVLYGQINYTVKPFSEHDLSIYRYMASVSPHINSDILKPFAYRVLGPFLVGLLPIPDPIGFYVFAVVFSILLVLQFYFLLRYIGLFPTESAITVLLFMFNKYLFGFTIWDYFQINDLLSLNFIIVLFLSMWKNQWVVFGTVLGLGALTRESSLLMIPVMFAYLLERKELSSKWREAVAVTIPGLVIFILIRSLIPTVGGNSLSEAFFAYSNKIYSPEHIFRLLVNSFLPLSFIPLIYWETTLRFFKIRKYALLYICLVFLSTLFGKNNERLMAPAFIIFYMLIGTILQDIKRKRTFYPLLIGGVFVSSLHHIIGRWLLPNIHWTYILTFGATLTATICMYIVKLRKYATGNHSSL